MIKLFLTALCALLIALYLQARKSARGIRRNRERRGVEASSHGILKPRGP